MTLSQRNKRSYVSMGEDDDFPEDIENAFAEANGLTATGVRSSKLFPDVNTTEGFAAIAEMIIAHEDSRWKGESSVDVDCRSDKVVDVSKVRPSPACACALITGIAVAMPRRVQYSTIQTQ